MRKRTLTSTAVLYGGFLTTLCIVAAVAAWALSGGEDTHSQKVSKEARPLRGTERQAVSSPAQSTSHEEHPPTERNVTRIWSDVITLGSDELDRYFVLHGSARLSPPRDFVGEAQDEEDPLEKALRESARNMAALSDPRYFPTTAEDYNAFGAGSQAPTPPPSRTKPHDVFESLRTLTGYLPEHGALISEYQRGLTRQRSALRQVADILSQYASIPDGKDLRDAISFRGITFETSEQIMGVIHFVSSAHARGLPMHIPRVRFFSGEVYAHMEQVERQLLRNNTLVAKALRVRSFGVDAVHSYAQRRVRGKE